MRYQTEGPRLAPPGFRAAVVNAAKAALQAPDITEQDRQLMYDIRRDEGRYAFRAIDRMFDLLAKLPSEAPAMELVVEIRSTISRRRAHKRVADVDVTYAEETAAQAEADVAQARALRFPSAENIGRARAACSKHIAGITRFMDDLTAMPVPGAVQ